MRALAWRNTKNSLRVEVHLTSCVVSQPPGDNCALVNPANNRMVGTDLPYFPVGGPVPNLPKHLIKNANTWGGMEIGANQMYSTQVVDGHVSELGGHTMKKALQALPVLDTKSGYRCFDGQAVISPATEGLQHNFKHIIHTVPPFYNDKNMDELLQVRLNASL
jgi:hypothetical protein